MGLISFLLVGLCAGWIAGNVVKGRGFGFVGDILIGIIGAFIGGFLFDLLEIHTYGFWGNVGMSAIGAVILLGVVGALRPIR